MPTIRIGEKELAVAIHIFIDDFASIDDYEMPIPLTTPNVCEKNICIGQMKDNLSPEARDVLNLLLDCPPEILEEITNGTGKIIKGKLKTYLKECCWKNSTIIRVFKELRKFKKEMETL